MGAVKERTPSEAGAASKRDDAVFTGCLVPGAPSVRVQAWALQLGALLAALKAPGLVLVPDVEWKRFLF